MHRAMDAESTTTSPSISQRRLAPVDAGSSSGVRSEPAVLTGGYVLLRPSRGSQRHAPYFFATGRNEMLQVGLHACVLDAGESL